VSSRGPAEACLRKLGRLDRDERHVRRRKPHQRRGSSSWMPTTAAIDNETLNHLCTGKIPSFLRFSGREDSRRCAAGTISDALWCPSRRASGYGCRVILLVTIA
jgi:hypothetical protein